MCVDHAEPSSPSSGPAPTAGTTGGSTPAADSTTRAWLGSTLKPAASVSTRLSISSVLRPLRHVGRRHPRAPTHNGPYVRGRVRERRTSPTTTRATPTPRTSHPEPLRRVGPGHHLPPTSPQANPPSDIAKPSTAMTAPMTTSLMGATLSDGMGASANGTYVRQASAGMGAVRGMLAA